MAGVAFIQCTGEPVQLQSARIPPAVWEEKKPQIISLFERHTLNDVMEKMAEAGFKPSRRQYIYQLQQWGITKYKANQGKKCDTNDAPNSKRKHAAIGDTHDGGQHPPSSSPSSQVASPSKRPKVAAHFVIGPDQEVDETEVVIEELRRPSPATAVREFWKAVYTSKPSWYAGKRNPETARAVSRLATAARSRQPQESSACACAWDHLTPANIQLYLRDIGEYLCGIGRGEEAFDLYALMLEGPRHPCLGGVYMTVLLSCVHSVNSPEECQWVASFLQRFDAGAAETHHSATWDALILARLFLARKFLRYGSHADAQWHASEARRLRERAFASPSYRSDNKWSTLNSVQDGYSFEVNKECDTANEASWTSNELARRRTGWDYSLLTIELDLLKSELLSHSKVIAERGLDAALCRAIGGEDEATGQITLSAVFFQLLWRTKFDELPQHLGSAWAEETRKAFHGGPRYIPLPNFVGTCCDILARKALQQHQHQLGSSAAKALAAWRDSLRDLDLVGIVSRMDTLEVHSHFVQCFCDRESSSRSETLSNLREPGDDYYSSWSDLINSLNREKAPAKLSSSQQQQQRSLLQGSMGRLNQTLGLPCRSSLASYRNMVEAGLGIDRNRRRTGRDRRKRADDSLPSNMLAMEDFNLSMGRISLLG
ncbi:hypothetical protein PG997_008757 [Apiospora hydei]|uniref:Clr5 domain-containing protein n=1 Tax=Apiospora hydei TaxID=1337664 RepID=A0ABR1WBQ8_9PEZI